MNIQGLVLRNLMRKKGRSFFTLFGIAIGIASFVTLLSLGGGLEREIKKQAGELGANLIVTPKGWCAYEQISVLTSEQLPEAIPMNEVNKISTIKGLTAVPYLTEKTAINNNPVPVIGVLADRMKAFKGWEMEKGSYFPAGDERAIVIGSGIAKQFQLRPADEVTIRGKKFPVIGILKETGGKDDIAIFMPLAAAQGLYEVGDKVSFVAIKVDDISRTDEYSLKIQETANVAVVSDRQLLKSVLSIVGTVSLTLQLIAVVAIMAAAFGIINTMMTAVQERRREIGILKAIGAKRSAIFKVFLLESGFYGLFGGAAGIAMGFAFTSMAAPYISHNEFTAFLKGSEMTGVFDLRLVLESVVFSLSVSVVSGFYPAWMASRLTPVEAISYE